MTLAVCPTKALARRVVTPPPLHVALPGNLAEKVRKLAAANNMPPTAALAELLQKLFDDKGDEAVLDTVELFALPGKRPGQGRRTLNSIGRYLTQYQAGALVLIGQNRTRGVFILPAAKLAFLLGCGDQHAQRLVLDLHRMGLLVRAGPRSGETAPQPWKLTPRGRAAYKELSGGSDV